MKHQQWMLLSRLEVAVKAMETRNVSRKRGYCNYALGKSRDQRSLDLHKSGERNVSSTSAHRLAM
jgi:hypothetical protein